MYQGLPGGPVVKNPSTHAGDTGLIPYATEQLSLHTTTTDSRLWRPSAAANEPLSPRVCAPHQGTHHNEKPGHRD